MGIFRNSRRDMVPYELEGTRTVVASGVQRVIVEGKDWGPAITKVVIEFNDYELASGTFNANFFKVEETIKGNTTNRDILSAYPCDANGKYKDGASKYIALELYVSPTVGSPTYFDPKTLSGLWHEDYNLTTTLLEDIHVDSHIIIHSFFLNKKVDMKNKYQRITPEVNQFKFEQNDTYNYAYFKPAVRKDTYPLVIWLHGGGEGGTDLYKCILGNKVVSLIKDEFQNTFGGAYILVPQVKTFWMQDENGQFSFTLKESPFEASLMALINDFVSKHPIDKTRIIVGGCSNGGYMTLQLLLNNPNYFAAGYPICEGLIDEYISDEKIKGLAKSNTGVYFVCCKEDPVFDHTKITIPTYKRLKEAGGNVHLAEFDEVVETYTGLEEEYNHKYNGHFSWVKFFNNECQDFWQKLAEEHK